MNKLDEILSISDLWERQKALIRLADSLHVDYKLSKDHSGNLIEEKLAIMIFDASHKRTSVKQDDYHFLVGGIVVVLVVLAMIMFLPKIISRGLKEDKARQRSKEVVGQGYDIDGNPIIQKGQPVIFKLLDGEYEEYDDKGNLQFINVYDQGRLTTQKEFNAKGEFISEKTF